MGRRQHNRLLTLTNATILDYDLDQLPTCWCPMPVIPTATLPPYGNISAYGFFSWGTHRTALRGPLQPCLSQEPLRAVHFGDMDGDGSIEQLVLVGEGSHHGVSFLPTTRSATTSTRTAVLISVRKGMRQRHQRSFDADDPRQSGNLTTSLNILSPGLPYVSDGYGIQMAFVNLSMHSITEGEFTFSGLDVRYTADFLVNANPSLTGNLSNALNQQMTAGSGTLQIPLQFNTSANGSFVIYSPNLGYADGAPNIALPPTPVLNLVDAQPDRVVIDWQPITAFGDDLLTLLYRSPAGQANLQTNYASTNTAPLTWRFSPANRGAAGCRAFTSFIASYPLPLTVDIPYPTPKSFVPNLTAADVLMTTVA